MRIRLFRNEIDYRVETGYKWIDTKIATFEYKVISGNKIKVNTFWLWLESY